MALFVVFSFLFSSSLVYHAVAQDNETVTTEVDMKSRCYSIGFKFVNIFWQPLPQDAKSPFKPINYKVFYCTSLRLTDSLDQVGQYQLGCTLNTTHQSRSQQKELQCTIGGQGLFPLRFYYKLEMRNSSGVFISVRKTCRLVSNNFQCTKPQNLRIQASGKRNLSLSWEPAKDMGRQTPLLCYRILFASEQSKANESVQITAAGEMMLSHTIEDLYPYTKYTIYIQCSLSDCYNGWGALTGPVTAMTKEEAPAQAPKFENWSVSNVDENKRNVTLVWKLPNRDTWNGVITHFVLHYWTINSSVSTKSHDASQVEICSNVSNTTGSLINLRVNETYAVTVQMCTRVGCGPTSEAIYIPAEETEPDTTHGPHKARQVNVFLIVGVTLGLALCIVCAFISVYLWRRKQRLKRNAEGKMKRLSEVFGDLSPPVLYDSPNEINGSGNYDKAFAPLLTDKPEYVHIRSSQTESLMRKITENDTDDNKNSTEV